MKNSSDKSGIEPANFRLVARRLNQLCVSGKGKGNSKTAEEIKNVAVFKYTE